MDFSATQARLATPEQAAAAFAALSVREQQSLRQIARLRALGLDRMGWEDLLHEALYRTLAGARRWPLEVNLVAFLAQTMRSIASEERARIASEPVDDDTSARDSYSDRPSVVEEAADPRTPEAYAMTKAVIRQIEDLFSDDPSAIQVLRGLAQGLTPAETQAASIMTDTEYASTQRRIQRALTRKFGKAHCE